MLMHKTRLTRLASFANAPNKHLFLLFLCAVALCCFYPKLLQWWLDRTKTEVEGGMAMVKHSRSRIGTESVTRGASSRKTLPLPLISRPPCDKTNTPSASAAGFSPKDCESQNSSQPLVNSDLPHSPNQQVPAVPTDPPGSRVPVTEQDKQISLRTMFQTPPTLGCGSSIGNSSLGGTEHTHQGNTLQSVEEEISAMLPPDPRLMYSNTCEPYTPPRTNKLILNLNRQEWWFIGDRKYENFTRGCTYDACTMTDDIRLLPQADAVLVYICRQNLKTPPPRASHKQIWIAFSMESPIHYSGFFDSRAWSGPIFNWTMNYRLDSDVFYPYSFLSLRPDPLVPSTKDFKAIAMRKHKSVAWFVSNCQTQSQRMKYVKELRRHIDVDIYGACGDKVCKNDNEESCLEMLNGTYFFYLAFENSLCRDYVTEKKFKLYRNVDAVPVVRGAANYSLYFPPGTFLDTANYSSPKALAQHLKALMADTQAYARMLERKDRFRLMGDTSRLGNTNHMGHNACELCRRLHNPGPPKVYPDIMKWVRQDACHPPDDLKEEAS